MSRPTRLIAPRMIRGLIRDRLWAVLGQAARARFAAGCRSGCVSELERPRPAVTPDYDSETCSLFVSPLGTALLKRALTLFTRLAAGRRVASLELAKAISVAEPRAIGGMLTSPLKRRAKQLGLPLPFVGAEGALAQGGIPDPRAEEDPGRT